jgi:hypothetical protein
MMNIFLDVVSMYLYVISWPLRTYGLGIRLGRYAKIGDNIGTHWQATICFSRKTTLYNSNTGDVR